jgi:hypothetical protein
MIEPKKKRCKGTGKAKGYGCGEKHYLHRYGLCLNCFKEWLFSNDGIETLNKSIIRGKKKSQVEKKKEYAKQKVSIKTKSYYEKKLQSIINEIVRLIDFDKGCISCNHGWNNIWSRQKHAGHRLSVGAYPELRYNVLNIFVQCSICNNYKSGNEREYDKGLKNHLDDKLYIEVSSLKGKYRCLNISINDLHEYIKIANRIKREILSGIDYTRKEINELIGIYI